MVSLTTTDRLTMVAKATLSVTPLLSETVIVGVTILTTLTLSVTPGLSLTFNIGFVNIISVGVSVIHPVSMSLIMYRCVSSGIGRGLKIYFVVDIIWRVQLFP